MVSDGSDARRDRQWFRGKRIRLRQAASRQGVPFELSIDDLITLFERQQHRCAISPDLTMTLDDGYQPTSLCVVRRRFDDGYRPENIAMVALINARIRFKGGADRLENAA